VILDYFSFASPLLGGRCSIFLVLMMHFLINVSVSSLSFFLAFKLNNLNDSLEINKPAQNLKENIGLPLLLIMFVTLVVTVLGKFYSCQVFMSINKNLHRKVIDSLINTKIVFFDENTSG
jgi:ABC-type multidrug transport system fused ATPase/permease subunit